MTEAMAEQDPAASGLAGDTAPPALPRDPLRLDGDPIRSELAVAALHGGPGNAMGDFFLSGRIPIGVAAPGVVEGGAEYVLSVLGQVLSHRKRQVVVVCVRHGFSPD